MKIVIDIGHADGTGAFANGVQEHDIGEEVAYRLQALLDGEETSVIVIDYPELSNSADLNASIAESNKIEADIVISLHCDYATNASAKGAHVCYYSSEGRKLAAAISSPLCELMPGRAEQIKRRTDLAILRKTSGIAVLIEMGFLTNLDDVHVLVNNQDGIARAIARGVLDYVKE